MSRQGLSYQIQLLDDFVAKGVTAAQVRRNSRHQVDSGKRAWKVTARPGDAGRYEQPVNWGMTAVDVVAAGKHDYCESVRRWAQRTHADIKSH
jgi:hypothetical protein